MKKDVLFVNIAKACEIDGGKAMSANFQTRPATAFDPPSRNDQKVFRAYVREYASRANSCQSGVGSSKNLFWACSSRLF
jgi:hypothetical protein